MILEIDVGNTALKWRLLDNSSCRVDGGCCDQYEEFLNALRDRYKGVGVVRVASVAKDDVVSHLCERVYDLWGVESRVAVTQKKYAGLTVAYEDPLRLGVDRWLAMLAARRYSDGAVCVIDCGSAITVDLVDVDGRQVGGYIVPGVSMQVQALLNSTGQIRLESSVAPCDRTWGCSTEEAVGFGVLRQISAFIDAVTAELLAESAPPVIYITGGDAGLLLPRLRGADVFYCRRELVMDGLAVALP